MQWLGANFPAVLDLVRLHLFQAVLPLVLCVLISVPLAQLARQNNVLRSLILALSSVLFTIPSLALFVFMPVLLGTRILDLANVMVALTIYAVALMVRTSLDALNSVDDGIRQAAVAVGFRPVNRFLTVDLPLSIPVLFTGLRVVSVSNVSLVSVGALLGIPSLGSLFIDGLKRDFITEIVIGIVGTLLLALVLDVLIVLLQRALTPWLRRTRPAVEATV